MADASIILMSEGDAPETPASGRGAIYLKTDHKPYVKGSDGLERPLGELQSWVQFNGTGTVTINASKGITSITDNGTGNYTVNFTNALADTYYGVSISTSDSAKALTAAIQTDGRNVSSVAVFTFMSSTGALNDSNDVNVMIFR